MPSAKSIQKLAQRWLAKQAAESASGMYAKRKASIDESLRKIQTWLKKHEADFKKEGSRNWGFVGDLGQVLEQLQNILEAHED